MPNTTSRLSLSEPVGADAPSTLRTSITTNATVLDSAVTWAEGTLSGRSGTPSYDGQVYGATDTNQTFIGLSSVWLPIGLTSKASGVTATVQPGQALTMTVGGTTANLPASPPVGSVVGVQAGGSITGASAVTVTGAVNTLAGPGFLGVTSITLGNPGAFVQFVWDGTFWRCVSGGEDTGWVALSLGTNVVSADTFTPSCRRVNGQVMLKGALTGSATVVLGTILATAPAGFRPPGLTDLNTSVTGSSYQLVQMNSSGQIAANGNLTTANAIPLNGCGYPLS